MVGGFTRLTFILFFFLMIYTNGQQLGGEGKGWGGGRGMDSRGEGGGGGKRMRKPGGGRGGFIPRLVCPYCQQKCYCKCACSVCVNKICTEPTHKKCGCAGMGK